MLDRIRKRFAAARAADALELEQALLRIGLNTVVYLYLLASILWDRVVDDRELALLAMLVCIVLLVLAQFAWILLRPGIDPLRRHAGVLLDIGSISVVVVLGEEMGAMIFAFYLWVIIGNGFRFGRWYLHFAQVLAVASFTAALFLSQYWREHLVLGIALLLVLLAIPGYVALLISRLHAANRHLKQARGEAEAANMAKSKFIAAASHDLRQPMQALSMYASVLEERIADANALRVVRGIQLSVTTLEQLFDSLLDISKIEAGVIKPQLVAFPLMPLIERVVEAERPIAEQKGLQVRVARTSASVRSDPALLERMLKNLVTNAIRYTDRGRVVVGGRRRGSGRLRLEVVDSGMGIALQEQERIFDEYYQLAGASALGLGLGLPIVKSLGELLGHPIAVRSTPGRGSVFSIEIERAPDVAVPAAAGHPPAPRLDGVNVVLVDDDAEIRNSLCLLLESWGCRCIGAATLAGVEAQLGAMRLQPDALIVDYRLTESMSGVQVIDRLRAAFGERLPALIITGTANPALLQQGAAGIPFAIKPVAPGKLRAFLSQVPRPRRADGATL